MGYRENAFNKRPCEKIISNISRSDYDHFPIPQKDNGTEVKLRLKGFHISRHIYENRKNCNIIHRLKAGIIEFEDEYF